MEREHWWFTARAEIVGELAQYLVEGSATVLDVGCGTGGMLSSLPESWIRIGVDPSAAATAVARRMQPEIDFRTGTAPEAVADALPRTRLLMLCDVLEHVEHDRDLLSSLVSSLEPSAHILITVPAHMRLWSRHDETHGHYRRYEPTDLARFWNDLPVRPLLVSPLNWRLYPIVRALRLAARIRRTSVGVGDTDLFLPPRPLNRLLHRIFASEERSLVRALEGARPPPFRLGVSWLVILERVPDSSTGEA
jgi:SAM-dependent methyltransferase